MYACETCIVKRKLELRTAREREGEGYTKKGRSDIQEEREREPVTKVNQ